jgi:hypothetical protein
LVPFFRDKSIGKPLALLRVSDLQVLPSVSVSIEKNIIEAIKIKHLQLIDELFGDISDSIFDLYEYANVLTEGTQVLHTPHIQSPLDTTIS